MSGAQMTAEEIVAADGRRMAEWEVRHALREAELIEMDYRGWAARGKLEEGLAEASKVEDWLQSNPDKRRRFKEGARLKSALDDIDEAGQALAQLARDNERLVDYIRRHR